MAIRPNRTVVKRPEEAVWHPLPPDQVISFEATCCEGAGWEVITQGKYADKSVLEAKSLIRCAGCHATWLLTGQARPMPNE